MKPIAAVLALLFLGVCAHAQIMLQQQGGTAQGKSKFVRREDGTYIYLTATGGNFYSCKLFPNGDLDDSYYGLRSSKKTFGGLVYCRTQTAQFDKWGRLLIAGSACIDSNSAKMATMVRLARNGDPDVDFTPVIAQLKVGDSCEFLGVYLLPDEKIMTLGACYKGGTYHTFLSRLQYNGEKDTTYGKGGFIIDENQPEYKPMLTEVSGGKYLVCGVTVTNVDYLIVKRYDVNGNIDTTFGQNGIAMTHGEGYQYINPVRMLLQPDGKILVVGNCARDKGNQDMFVVRLNSNGSIDSSFANAGVGRFDITSNDRAEDVALLPDGQIMLAGSGSAKGDTKLTRYIMLRLAADGKAEKGYGYGSEKGLPPPSEGTGYTTIANNIAISPHGNKVNRLKEFTGGHVGETILIFATYLQDSALGIMDIPVGKLQNFIYPIPVSNNVTFSFELIEDLNVTVKLLDASGTEISTLKSKELYPEGENMVSINLPAGSKPGKYFVVLSSEVGYKITVEINKI